jgi:putative ABC transport system substrate-binding protein
MRRRGFIKAIIVAAAWPLAARAQQADSRRIGVLMSTAEADRETAVRYTAFLQTLQELGWTKSRNLQIDIRWVAGDPERAHKYAAELVALAPDAIMASGSISLAPLLKTTHTVPIVFALVADPVGARFVKSQSRPGGNATGFMVFEYSLSAKWPELLKEVAPNVTRVAVLRDPSISSDIGQFAVIQSVTASIGLEPSPIDVDDPSAIERSVADFANSPNGGLIIVAGARTATHRT